MRARMHTSMYARTRASENAQVFAMIARAMVVVWLRSHEWVCCAWSRRPLSSTHCGQLHAVAKELASFGTLFAL